MVLHVDNAARVTTPVVSVCSEKPTSAPPHLSDVSPMLSLRQFQYLSDWQWPSLVLSRKIFETVPVFVWLTMTLSCPFKEDHLALVIDNDPLSSFQGRLSSSSSLVQLKLQWACLNSSTHGGNLTRVMTKTTAHEPKWFYAWRNLHKGQLESHSTDAHTLR